MLPCLFQLLEAKPPSACGPCLTSLQPLMSIVTPPVTAFDMFAPLIKTPVVTQLIQVS